jgi:hypothetical protein
MRSILAAALAAACLLAPAAHAETFAGHSSWYGGPCDRGQDNNRTASGIPNTVPGFATRWVPFGRWYLIETQGRRALGMSLERGPASRTGRTTDLNYTLVARLRAWGAGPCFPSYPNGWVTATRIDPALRYPSCGWAARLAGKELRHRVRSLGRPGNCLIGSAADRLRRFQRAHRRPHAARTGTVDLATWRLLYRAG